jgi:type II secretory pathway component GspD/PulD (secretin)
MKRALSIIVMGLFLSLFSPHSNFAQEQKIYLPEDDSKSRNASVAVPLSGGSSGQNANLITLEVKGMDVVDVLQMLAKRSSLSLVIGKNVTGRVALFLKDIDVRDAFEIVILANDLAYETKGNIINIMTQRDYELLYGERYQDKKKIKSVSLKYANAMDLSQSLNQMKTNIGRVIVDGRSNTVILIDTPQKIKEMEDFIHKADILIETQIFNLKYAQADKISPSVQEVLTKGVGSVKVDARTNKIAVTDSRNKLEEVSRLIAAFDEKTRQVVIDAQIVEINPLKDQFSMGVDWDYWLKKNMRFAGSLPAPVLSDATAIPNILSFGVAAAGSEVTQQGQYKSVINLLRVIGKTKIISSPRIMALNNQEAKILVGTKEAYITSTVSQTGTTAVTSQSVSFVDVGIKLYVTPTINADGFVTMKIRPEISSSKTTDIISEGQITQIPIVTTSEAETAIMVKDGATIVIAGLKKDTRDKEVKKFPFLGDLPLVGFLFRSVRDESTKTELVIFLTPHIVSGEETFPYTSLTKDKDIEAIQTHMTKTKEATAFKDNRYYREYIVNKVQDAWMNIRLREHLFEGQVKVRFVLMDDGGLKADPRVISSTDFRLDKLAIDCIGNSLPFPPFPEDYHGLTQGFEIILKADK